MMKKPPQQQLWLFLLNAVFARVKELMMMIHSKRMMPWNSATVLRKKGCVEGEGNCDDKEVRLSLLFRSSLTVDEKEKGAVSVAVRANCSS